MAYLKKVKKGYVESLGKESLPMREEEEVCDGVRASLKKEGSKEQADSGGKEPMSTMDLKGDMHAKGNDTVQESLLLILLPSVIRVRRTMPLPLSITDLTCLGEEDGTGVNKSSMTTDLNPLRLLD